LSSIFFFHEVEIFLVVIVEWIGFRFVDFHGRPDFVFPISNGRTIEPDVPATVTGRAEFEPEVISIIKNI